MHAAVGRAEERRKKKSRSARHRGAECDVTRVLVSPQPRGVRDASSAQPAGHAGVHGRDCACVTVCRRLARMQRGERGRRGQMSLMVVLPSGGLVAIFDTLQGPAVVAYGSWKKSQPALPTEAFARMTIGREETVLSRAPAWTGENNALCICCCVSRIATRPVSRDVVRLEESARPPGDPRRVSRSLAMLGQASNELKKPAASPRMQIAQGRTQAAVFDLAGHATGRIASHVPGAPCVECTVCCRGRKKVAVDSVAVKLSCDGAVRE